MRHKHRIAALAACAASIFAVSASPALAQSLSLTGPSSATVGQPVTLQASGTVPEDAFLTRYINAYAIPTSALPSCPATYQGAIQAKDAAAAQGGDTVAVVVPVEGNFSVPILYTGKVPGQFLICAYLHELAVTEAVASHAISVAAQGGGGGGTPPPSGGPVVGGDDDAKPPRPAVVKKPKVKRARGKLVCNRGRWSGNPTRFAFHWKVNGKRKAGAKRKTLKITDSLEGKSVRCGVKAIGPGGSRTVVSPSVRVG
ncbi:MAG TPA: hypothetical protein VHF88_02950 [Thermoleophilaceae bacterium]|nr:hypothetical protein [Thermoleophilaceae bacterium]